MEQNTSLENINLVHSQCEVYHDSQPCWLLDPCLSSSYCSYLIVAFYSCKVVKQSQCTLLFLCENLSLLKGMLSILLENASVMTRVTVTHRVKQPYVMDEHGRK